MNTNRTGPETRINVPLVDGLFASDLAQLMAVGISDGDFHLLSVNPCGTGPVLSYCTVTSELT